MTTTKAVGSTANGLGGSWSTPMGLMSFFSKKKDEEIDFLHGQLDTERDRNNALRLQLQVEQDLVRTLRERNSKLATAAFALMEGVLDLRDKFEDNLK